MTNANVTGLARQKLGRRIFESEIDEIISRQARLNPAFVEYLGTQCFGPTFILKEVLHVATNVHVDLRSTGNSQLYGENDVEIVVSAQCEGRLCQLALLIENKIDAPIMPNQGGRYRARGRLRQAQGEWSDFRCAFVAPADRINQLYPLGNAEGAGWHNTISFESIATVLASGASADCVTDAQLLFDATLQLNHFNAPVPAAVRFWEEYKLFAAVEYPSIDVIVKTEAGSRAGGVWPSFFEADFRRSKDPLRKRIQIVHVDNSARVVLFLKKVDYDRFQSAVSPLLEVGMRFTRPGKSWQGVTIPTPSINPRSPLSEQADPLHKVFRAAVELKEFFDSNATIMLNLLAT